jgi:hypothetical protein
VKIVAGGLMAVILVRAWPSDTGSADQTMPAIWDVVNAGQIAGDDAKLLFINA